MMKWLESLLFASRWMLVLFFGGLIVSFGVLLVKMGQHVFKMAENVFQSTEISVTLDVLGVIDMTLLASLIVIVIVSGYENFVARIDPASHGNWPEWMVGIDFSALKLKLMSTIIAIAAIHLLRSYLEIEDGQSADLKWAALILLAFAATTVLMSLADRIDSKH